ncbi:MAG: cytochrome c [Sneathiellales bacterium]|nr:cytochrome c [Sneathiellales bacterium]
MKQLMISLGSIAVIAFLYLGLESMKQAGETGIAVKLPELSSVSKRGQALFNENCASCHGVNASGTEQGPPLIHDIYNPAHHDDRAFYAAVRNGVRQHHWPYGNMPPQPQVSNLMMADILHFIRETQIENGIFNKPHQMQ